MKKILIKAANAEKAIIAFKKGKNQPKNKVMLSAHMDEVGFIVTYICDNGFLKFNSVIMSPS